MNAFASPGRLAVVKFGGNAISDAATRMLLDEVAALRADHTRVVLVHGGGPAIDRALAERAVSTQRVEGMRVTDALTLEVAERVLCASVNKALVRSCLAAGLPAVGISGQDARLLVADPKDPRLGYVGEIVAVHPGLLHALLDAGYLPVVAPLGVTESGLSALNVNADTAAGAIAGALRADAFVLVTNVDQVRSDPDDPATGIAHMTLSEARAFAASDACRDSMRPKMGAAIAAIDGGARRSVICASLSGLHHVGRATVIDDELGSATDIRIRLDTRGERLYHTRNV